MTRQRFLTISVLMIVLAMVLTYLHTKNPTSATSPTTTGAQTQTPTPTLPIAVPASDSPQATVQSKVNSENEKATRALLYAKSRNQNRNRNLAQRHAASVPLQNSAFIRNALSDGRWQLTTLKTIPKTDPAAQQAVAEVDQWALIDSRDNFDFKNFDKKSPAAVFDARLKKFGLLTGTLKVITDQPEDLTSVLSEYAADITQSFPQIQTYFITSRSDIFNLESLYSALKAQSSVRSVELEVLDRQYERN